MNKNTIIVVVLAILILGGGLLYINNQSSNKPSTGASMERENGVMEKTDGVMQKEDSAMENESGAMMKDDSTSKYTVYSKTDLDGNTDKRRVLYFYASWCPTCRIADPELSANSSKFPEDVVVIRVNYNDPDTDQEEKDLAKKYTVTYQHTFVQIDGEGKEVTTWNGGQTDELLANIR